MDDDPFRFALMPQLAKAQARIAELEAANDLLIFERDAARSRAERRLQERESWTATAGEHAKAADAATVRAEKAEAEAERLRAEVDRLTRKNRALALEQLAQLDGETMD